MATRKTHLKEVMERRKKREDIRKLTESLHKLAPSIDKVFSYSNFGRGTLSVNYDVENLKTLSGVKKRMEAQMLLQVTIDEFLSLQGFDPPISGKMGDFRTDDQLYIEIEMENSGKAEELLKQALQGKVVIPDYLKSGGKAR